MEFQLSKEGAARLRKRIRVWPAVLVLIVLIALLPMLFLLAQSRLIRYGGTLLLFIGVAVTVQLAIRRLWMKAGFVYIVSLGEEMIRIPVRRLFSVSRPAVVRYTDITGIRLEDRAVILECGETRHSIVRALDGVEDLLAELEQRTGCTVQNREQT